MIRVISIVFFAGMALAGVPPQDQGGAERLVLNFSDPSRPGLLKVDLVNNGIAVRSYGGKEVIIESRSGNRDRRPPRTLPRGARVIGPAINGLRVEEANNVITITTQGPGPGDLSIQVPARTNLNLRTANGERLVVEGVEGDIEAMNTNGSVILNNVAGSVVAHAENGRVIASLRRITANKPMSLTAMNENVEVTLPPTAKATVKLRMDNGETISDFEIQLRPASVPSRTLTGTINGGGPDLELRTLNGNIYIRKGN